MSSELPNTHLLSLLGVRQWVPEERGVSVGRVGQNTELLLQQNLLSCCCVWICKSWNQDNS